MPNFEVSDCVFSLQPGEWKVIVSGRIHGSFQSRGAAEAGMQVEQSRAAARAALGTHAQATAYLSLPTNAPIETVLGTLDLYPQAHCEAIAEELSKFGYEANAEGTGGGIICVKIDDFPANGYWYAGTANENWGMTFWDEDGGADNLDTDCLTEEPDPAKVAAAIHAAFVKAGHTFEGDNPRYPRADWVYEVENDCTNLGYKEWAKHQRESEKDEDKVASVQIAEQRREEMSAYHADALRKAMGVSK